MSVNEADVAAAAGTDAATPSTGAAPAGGEQAPAGFGADATDDDYVPPPDLDHRCIEVVLEPAAAAVGQLTKAVVRLVEGVSVPQPPGANMPAIDKVRWEARVPDGRWLPVPDFAKPFPWDPHTITPPADLAGLTVRAAGVVMDPETDRPALEYEGPNSAGEDGAPEAPGVVPPSQGPKRRARPRVYLSPPATVAVPPRLDAAARKAATMPKFGFHCSIGSASNMRLLCLITHRGADPSEGKPRGLVIEALAVPNSDKAPVVAVFRGVVHLGGGPAAALGSVHRTGGTACDQHPADHVTLALHVDAVEHMAEARIKPALLVDPSRGPCGISVVVRNAKDRDMVTLCLRAVHAAWEAAAPAAAAPAAADGSS